MDATGREVRCIEDADKANLPETDQKNWKSYNVFII